MNFQTFTNRLRGYQFRKLATAGAFVLTTVFLTGQSAAQVTWLGYDGSPRSVALGTIRTTLIDEYVQTNSPGAFALGAKNYSFIVCPVSKAQIYPDDYDIPASLMSVAFGFRVLGNANESDRGPAIYGRVGFSRLVIDLPDSMLFDERNRPIRQGGEATSDLYSIGIALDYIFDLGVGGSVRRVNEELIDGTEYSGQARPRDIGVALSLPITDYFSALSKGGWSKFRFELVLAMSRLYSGDDAAYSGPGGYFRFESPMFATDQIGINLHTTMLKKNREALSLMIAKDWNSGVNNDYESSSVGLELGVARTLYGRMGWLTTVLEHDLLTDTEFSNRRDMAYGIGFRLEGLLDLLYTDKPKDRSYSFKKFLLNHFDLQCDWAVSKFYGLDRNYISLGLAIK